MSDAQYLALLAALCSISHNLQDGTKSGDPNDFLTAADWLLKGAKNVLEAQRQKTLAKMETL